MKKVFFILVFMLINALAFANSSMEVEATPATTEITLIEQFRASTNVIFSVQEDWCIDVIIDKETGEVVLILIYRCD